MTLPDLSLVTAVLFEAALRGAVILAIAALLVLALRKRSAATRHAVWTTALLAQLALPLLGVILPDWRVAVAGLPAWLEQRRPATSVASSPGVAPLGERLDALDTKRARLGHDLASLERTLDGDAGVPPRHQDATATPTSRHQANANVIESPRPLDGDAPARPGILALLWIAGCLAIVARHVAGTIAVSRLAGRGRRVHDGDWLSLAQRIADRLGIRRPLTLLRGDRLAVPVTWGVIYPVVLLPEESDEWPAERRTYVLVHEMAHVKRFDALTQLVSQVALAFFWFDPLVWYAARRMRAEREHACDDYVLRHGTTPSTYASDLLEMVRTLGSPAYRRAQPAFAALAMARRSEFEGRMLSILDPRQDRDPLRARGSIALAGLAMLLVVPLAVVAPTHAAPVAPAAAAPVVTFSSQESPPSPRRAPEAPGTPAPPPAESARRWSANGELPDESRCRAAATTYLLHTHKLGTPEASQQAVLVTQSRCVRAGIRGEPRFSDDERDAGASPRGELHLADLVRGRAQRELIVRADAAGRETRRYLVGGVERPVEESREWLAEVIPFLLRHSGIDVKGRVARILRRGGADAVLREIAMLEGDDMKRAYYNALFATPGLPAADVDRAMRQVPRDITSDGALRSVLGGATRRAGGVGGFDAATMGEAVRHITSDGDLRAVLTRFITQGDRSFRLMALREARRITSDGDLSALLVLAAPYVLVGDDAELQRDYFRAAQQITSDGDLANVLAGATKYARPGGAITDGIIATSTRITSDGDRANVLVRLAGRDVLQDKAVRAKFLESAKGITSDGDYRRVIEALP